MNALEKIEQLEKELAELKRQISKPKFGQLKEGWYIDSMGEIKKVTVSFSFLGWNCFPAKESTEYRQKLREAEDELYNIWLHLTDGGWEPDWEGCVGKCFVFYDNSKCLFDIDFNNNYKAHPKYRYYSTKELAKQSLELMSDHAKWYLREG